MWVLKRDQGDDAAVNLRVNLPLFLNLRRITANMTSYDYPIPGHGISMNIALTGPLWEFLSVP
jgi:hypothetical protein